MDYQQFKDKLQTELPVNRKEVFYTATVLPALLIHNGLANFFMFLAEIKGLPKTICEENTKDQFFLYTEYNLKEAGVPRSGDMNSDALTGTRPDLLIYIFAPEKAVVVIEGKMFQNLSQTYFANQMKTQQQDIIEPLKERLALDDSQIFHVALVPEKLRFSNTADYQVINWEFFIDNKVLDVEDNYFYNSLRFAIENYDDLVSEHSAEASTVEFEVSGQKVYSDGTSDTPSLWIGREGGRRTIEKDVEKGTWTGRVYCANTLNPEKGRKGNWLSSREFAEIVDERRGVAKSKAIRRITDY